ncbi:MAG: caspase family protein [Hyphomicrobiales bacterium]|nr:caspase family protein [Hyphomicrobiales bacterium]
MLSHASIPAILAAACVVGRRFLPIVVVAILIAVAASATAHAKTEALIVAVSAYPNLGEEQSLQGPKNDAKLLREVLVRRGVGPDRITVLADDVDGAAGLPTRARIFAELDRLHAAAARGDQIILYFAGHGSRQIAHPDARQVEANGFDEVFLPRDAKPISEDTGLVGNAITDNDINLVVTRLRNAGAFVWLIFDSCHSGDMARGASGDRDRRVKIALTPRELESIRAKIDAEGWSGPEVPDVPDLSADAGGYVAFYAAQTDQTTPERQMKRSDPSHFGLFSYTLSHTLARFPGASYRLISQEILARYLAIGQRTSTPVFEGSGLDQIVLDAGRAELRPQWTVELVDDGLALAAGSLNGVDDGDIIALFDGPLSDEDGLLGYARVDAATPFKSTLVPIAHNGLPDFAPADLPSNVVGRLDQKSVRTALRVARPGPGTDERVKAVFDRLAGAEIAGFPVEWVAPENPADIRIVEREGRIFFTAASGAIRGADDSVEAPFVPVGDAERLNERIVEGLRTLGKARNLLRLATDAAVDSLSGRLDIRAEILRVDPAVLEDGTEREGLNCRRARRLKEPEPIASGTSLLRHCDVIRLSLTNISDSDLDLTVLFVDSAAGIASVFPRGGRSNRILRGDTAPTITLAATTVDANGNPSTTGIEQLLFLAQPAREGAPEADFRFLAQPGISTARGNGGGLAGILAVAGFVAPKARGAMTLDVGDGDSRGAAAILSWRLVRDQ